jgi:uncharacterized protein (TIGR02246 family)
MPAADRIKPHNRRPAMPEPTTSTPRSHAGGLGSLSEARSIAEELLDATSRAWAVGDAQTFALHYTENATVALPGVLLEGRAAIREAMGAAFAHTLNGSRRTHTVRSARLLTESVAVVLTRSGTAFPGEPDIPAERSEIATWVLVKSDERWHVAGYHSCSETATDA